MSSDCNCAEWREKQEKNRQDECACSCEVPKKTGSYIPDTPTLEIDRRIREAKEKAFECQRVWQKTKYAPAPGFVEPPPLGFPGCIPPPPEEPEPEPPQFEDNGDREWCERLSQILTPSAVPMVQTFGPDCKCEPVELSCPCGCEDSKGPAENTASETIEEQCSEEPVKKPKATECKKFLNYAKGLSNSDDDRMELYDPRIKDKARDNIKSCMYLGGSCFDAFDKAVAATENKQECSCKCDVEEEPADKQRVENVPEGCCDYRTSTGSEIFIVPEEVDCPPMPDPEVAPLVMPPWFECPKDSSFTPLPVPIGAKIKPISKGIRTNFERNPTCLCCGAKRKDPFKKKCTKDLNQNCPAMKTRCLTSNSKVQKKKKDNSYLAQVKNIASSIGIKW
jgi:hypothetical protein